MNTASATQFCASLIVKRPVGGRWNQLNARAPRIAVAVPSSAPHPTDTTRTATRYTTTSAVTGAISFSGKTISVVSATLTTAATTPSHALGLRSPVRPSGSRLVTTVSVDPSRSSSHDLETSPQRAS